MADTPDTVRLDVWLWRARFFKTRRLAGAFVAKRRIRLARGEQALRPDKPHFGVAPGDVLTFARMTRIVRIRVEALGERRGPASEAQGLYSAVDDDDMS